MEDNHDFQPVLKERRLGSDRRALTRREPLDVERLARVLTVLDPDTGQDDWQLIHVSQGDDYAKSRIEWAHAIAAEYARLGDADGG